MEVCLQLQQIHSMQMLLEDGNEKGNAVNGTRQEKANTCKRLV